MSRAWWCLASMSSDDSIWGTHPNAHTVCKGKHEVPQTGGLSNTNLHKWKALISLLPTVCSFPSQTNQYHNGTGAYNWAWLSKAVPTPTHYWRVKRDFKLVLLNTVLWNNSFIHSPIHLVVTTKHLLSVRHCSEDWGSSHGKRRWGPADMKLVASGV